MAKSSQVPVAYLRESLETNEHGDLFWKERPAAHFLAASRQTFFNNLYAGKPAGRTHHSGYVMVSLTYQGRNYKLLGHRVVWALTNGEWPEQTIDHKNRVRADNRPTNLRDVSHIENMRNASRVYDRSAASPLPGVYANRAGRWRSQIKRNGRITYLGCFDTPQEAHSAFMAAAASHQQEAAS